MPNDYRNTKYCPAIDFIEEKKKIVRESIAHDHPMAKDMHTYLRQDSKPYKTEFMKAYNGKCAYCGVSVEILPKHSFEIDHYIYEKSPQFGGSKAAAGSITNLILACHACNHRKSSFEIPNELELVLNPDKEAIKTVFVRDEEYYIKIANEHKSNPTIENFYKRLNLGGELRRLDYLLMNIMGLQKNLQNRQTPSNAIDNAVELLRKKRNVMG